ncbi:uncharacterized protein GGS22DRAFT_159565 [Annulohypoxylon maeteangense]|uniref:uncharacterized protein n=1 Tax=Annulohypoxylon maeteangense TaxID=1927788 RepID=UPI002008715D|nr:uncharacterized protein GGS22DRAFT_159565 [Annulohypoxylon maeteangense]KAI0885998.1 hypothetical protein GGS22DRAFT_159565 [Annulohypoxylon maeteangense]
MYRLLSLLYSFSPLVFCLLYSSPSRARPIKRFLSFFSLDVIHTFIQSFQIASRRPYSGISNPSIHPMAQLMEPEAEPKFM